MGIIGMYVMKSFVMQLLGIMAMFYTITMGSVLEAIAPVYKGVK